MKNISYLAATSQASSVSGMTTSPSPNPMGSATLPSINFDDYPQGPLVKVILYHPSLFKIEQDFPNVIYIQDIPRIVCAAIKTLSRMYLTVPALPYYSPFYSPYWYLLLLRIL